MILSHRDLNKVYIFKNQSTQRTVRSLGCAHHLHLCCSKQLIAFGFRHPNRTISSQIPFEIVSYLKTQFDELFQKIWYV